MNKLTTEKRTQVVRCLVEGTSVRATVRITGVAKNTITKLGRARKYIAILYLIGIINNRQIKS